MDTASHRPAVSRTSSTPAAKVAVIYHGDAERRRNASPETSKVPSIFPALAAVGLEGVPVVYHDDVRDLVREQLRTLQAALVWVNPIEQGSDRTHLDALLREAAAHGVYVSTHPDTILKLGTKQVLVDTQAMSWSAPGTQVYRTPDELRAALHTHGAMGATRVLKQYRGHSGIGIWKVEPESAASGAGPSVRVREAPRGSVEQVLSIDAFVERCAEYFAGAGRMIDQPYQPRLPEGMTRCYLVHDRVEGFGHQAVNALCPAPAGAPRDAFPPTTQRLYSPPDYPAFQALKRQLETEWLPQLMAMFHLTPTDLPALWDCDFLLGEKNADGTDRHVLCEINVSSVSPFPESVLAPLARAVRARVDARR
ncbi:MAG: Cj0069 family protein [Betaproteobacteria bacterium]|nr:Cj0069 family protein [Betaproteobacteria bacterium]